MRMTEPLDSGASGWGERFGVALLREKLGSLTPLDAAVAITAARRSDVAELTGSLAQSECEYTPVWRSDKPSGLCGALP